MAAEEIDIIQHLLEVESEASQMVSEAQTKADKIIADAKSQAEAEFKIQYSKVCEEIEKSELKRKNKILENRKKSISEYIERLDASEKDFAGFNKYLDSVFYS